MSAFFSNPLAAGFLGLGLAEIVIIVVGFTLFLALPIAIVAIVFLTRRRQDELWHQTARLALEKGQPIPPFPQSPSSSNDLRNGLIMVGTGAALSLFLGALGAIPAFIGIALLVNWAFDHCPRRPPASPENRPPSAPSA